MKLKTFILMLGLVASHAGAANVENPRSANYYERLGVTKSVSAEELKKTYKRLAMKYHPDRHPEIDRSIFQNINEAWDTLQNPEKRAEYDRSNSEHPLVSKAPKDWFKNTSFSWDSSTVYEFNIFRALVYATGTSRIYINSLAEAMDWQNKNGASKHFLIIVEPVIRGFSAIHRASPPPPDFTRHAAMIDNIFSFSMTAKFPHLVEIMLNGEMADHLVGSILTKPQWKKHPELANWLFQAMSKDSAPMTTALVAKFLPTLGSERSKKLFLQKIISTASPAGLRALADKIPLSTSSPDYSSEIRTLIARGGDEVTWKLAKRFNVFLSSRLAALPPADYYQIGLELSQNSTSNNSTMNENKVDPNHPVNKNSNFKSDAPADWFKHQEIWDSQKTYLYNLVRAMLRANDHTRDYVLNLAKDIDWTAPPVAAEFSHMVLSLGFGSIYAYQDSKVTPFQQRAMFIQRLFALPMTSHFPHFLKNMELPAHSDAERYKLIVFAIQEMARQAHWLNSPQLNVWIEKLHNLSSKSVTEALTNSLLPELAGNERKSAQKIIYGHGAEPANACHAVFM